MNSSSTRLHSQSLSTVYFLSGDALRSRCVSKLVFSVVLELSPLPVPLLSDVQRDVTSRLCLEPGDVDELSLPRARTRWPDYSLSVQSVADWVCSLGLQELLTNCDVALMACRGARYHFDAGQYGGMAFCNLFLSEDCGLDLHFPATGHLIPLVRGTVVIFDTGQPHRVILLVALALKRRIFLLSKT